MKILYVLEYYYPHIGGAEILFQNLAEGMAERGNEIKVITNYLNGTKKNEILNGVFIKRIKLPKPKRFFFTFFSFPFIMAMSKEIDIIHASTYGGVFSASFAGYILKKPTVLSVHEIWLEEWKNVSFVSKIQKISGPIQEIFLLSLPFNIRVSESKYTLKRLIDLNFKDSIQIKGCVSVPENLKWEEKKENSYKFIYFGRPGHWRGVDLLIKAFSELLKENKNVKLILILSKEPEKEYNEIMKLILNLKISENVEIKEPMEREELFKFIINANSLVIPSISEGFGLSAAEGCALSIPIISSNAGSLPEVVSGKCLFFEKGNILDLKEKMKMAIEERWEFIEKKKFPKEDFLDKWENLYRRLVL